MTGTATEISIVKNNMLSKKYKDIALLLDCSVERVAGIVSELLAGTAIVPYEARFPLKKRVEKSWKKRKCSRVIRTF